MGQWATRSRRGGGSTPSLNEMVDAVYASEDSITVVYATSLGLNEIETADFTTNSQPSPATISVESDTEILLTWPFAIDDSTNLVYNGNANGIRSPQTIPIS